MFPWYFGTIVGCIGIASVTGWMAELDLNFRNFLLTSGPIILINLFFWYGFANSRSYLTCYIFGNAGTIVTGLLVSYFFKGEPIGITTLLGAVLVAIGGILVFFSLK